MRIPCYLNYDADTGVVELTAAKTGCSLMKLKLEDSAKGTMDRIHPSFDCDNFWIGVKPADADVAKLFGRKKLRVEKIIFDQQ